MYLVRRRESDRLRWEAWVIILSVVVLDQIIKVWVVRSKVGYVVNPGGSLSIFSGRGGIYSSISIFMLLLVFIWANKFSKIESSWLKILGGSLILGGGISNTLDRVLRGGVIDFINVFGVFKNNLADIAIVVGLGLVLLVTIFHGRIRANGTQDNI